MRKTKVASFKVKHNDFWIVVDNVEVSYWAEYKNKGSYYFEELHSIDIDSLKVPSWASFLKDKIEYFIKNNPRKLEFSYTDVIEVP